MAGRKILGVRYLSPLAAGGSPEAMAEGLAGQRILGLERKGKYLIFKLDTGWITVHLRMTGKLLIDGERSPWTRAVIELDNGHTLVFEDVRQFGRMLWSREFPAAAARLGPDALELSATDFVTILRGRRASLKPLLLNQQVLSGLGNIYVDEALHRARLHPLSIATRLSRARLLRLHQAVAEVLAEALAAGGSSISDYVDADGRRGWFQTSHRVYGAGGRAMPKLCDADPPHCGCPARHALLPSLPATVTRHRRIRPTAGHLTRDTELKPRLRDDKTMQTSDTLHSPVTPRIETRYRRMVTDFPVPESLPILEKLEKYELRAMGGQPPVVWDRAEGFQVWGPLGQPMA